MLACFPWPPRFGHQFFQAIRRRCACPIICDNRKPYRRISSRRCFAGPPPRRKHSALIHPRSAGIDSSALSAVAAGSAMLARNQPFPYFHDHPRPPPPQPKLRNMRIRIVSTSPSSHHGRCRDSGRFCVVSDPPRWFCAARAFQPSSAPRRYCPRPFRPFADQRESSPPLGRSPFLQPCAFDVFLAQARRIIVGRGPTAEGPPTNPV